MPISSDLGHNDIFCEFTFVWKITNFKYCSLSKGMSVKSPVFSDKHNRRWQLCFYPSGYDSTSVKCTLSNLSCSAVSFKCHFCVCNTELELLYDEERNISFQTVNSGYPASSVIASFEREIFEKLSEDPLVLHCHLRKLDSMKIEQMTHCFAETRLNLQQTIFSRIVENFNSLKLGENTTFDGLSYSTTSTLNVKLLIWGENLRESTVQISLTFENMRNQTFTSCALFLTDENESVLKYLEKEDWLGPAQNIVKFSIDRAVIIEAELPNGNLIVTGKVRLCGDPSDYKGSLEGMVHGMKTNEAVAAVTCSHIHAVSYSQAAQPLSSENRPSALSADMLSLYKGEGPPSDFQLTVEGRCFPVHQLVLGARSTVFRAMFTNDMLERSKRSLEITDVDADTTERMLTYVYTDEGPPFELGSESLADLYAAADKYTLLGLREICAKRLVQGLTLVSAPVVLKIADQHKDPLLKKDVVDYIISQGLVAIKSEYWKKLEQDNPKLSNEVLHQVIERNLQKK